MTAGTGDGSRIATLDIVRGVAVMGILAMNIADFAMPPQAYINPLAYGNEGPADLVSWAFGFILFDGKMRGLFSFLFGASMLLVLDRAEAKGEPAASVHLRRMAWLGIIGLLHYYLIWRGDILFGYAVAGAVAWFFHTKELGAVVRWGAAFVAIQFLIFVLLSTGIYLLAAEASAPGASAETLRAWAGKTAMFGVPTAEQVKASLELYRGSYVQIAGYRMSEQADGPFSSLLLFSWETIGYMLFGMAALRTGFLTGEWDDARYRRIAMLCLGSGLAIYAAYAALLWRDGFSVELTAAIWSAATVPVRALTVLGFAALIVLLTRRGGPLVGRIAAAGRAAFTNYLGTSLVMTALFYGYGFGLFGELSRAELWLAVIPAWAAMLLWSKPWLERFRYGPFEWLWRSLARGGLQPMRR